MKYWTAFGFGRCRTNNGWQVRGKFPFEVGGNPKKEGEGGIAFVLVDPEPKDFLSLKNAAVYPYNDRVFVAVPPDSMDYGYVAGVRSHGHLHAQYSDWFKEKRCDEVFLIKDGERTTMCNGCSKIILRAAGACIPGSFNCKAQIFSKNARMHEPEGVFIKPNNCCARKPFSTFTLHDILLDAPVEQMLEGPKRDTHSVLKSILTRQVQQLSCAVCMFGRQYDDKTYGCGAGCRRATYCGGPFFPSDVPQPSMEHRIAVRTMGERIPYEKYKQLAEVNGWGYKNWKNPPDLVLGYSKQGFNHQGGSQLVVWQMPGRHHRNDTLTKEEDWLTVEQEFVKVRKVPTQPATIMERLLIHMLKEGTLYRGENRGWGYSSHLSVANYCDRKDSCQLTWNLATFSFTRDIHLLSELFGQTYLSLDRARSGQIVDIMKTRKLGSKTEMAVMKKTLQKLVDAEKAGEELPSIPETYEKLLLTHK